jgi:hypothetical protein
MMKVAIAGLFILSENKLRSCKRKQKINKYRQLKKNLDEHWKKGWVYLGKNMF